METLDYQLPLVSSMNRVQAQWQKKANKDYQNATKKSHNADKHGCIQMSAKYFFLSDGWTVGRVWEFGGLWNIHAWRRPPEIQQMNLCILEQGEKLWLYRVEEAVLMVEVTPTPDASAESAKTIGQVVLKRLITADQVIERLASVQTLFDPPSVE